MVKLLTFTHQLINMKQIFTSLLLLCSAVAFSQKTTTDKRFAGLDTAFARVLKDWKAAGFAVAVVEKNKVIYSQGFGYKDYESKIPVTPNTLFAIGSCTKAFTASLLGLLEKDGQVDFDKPVKTYLPALNFFNNDMNNNVTLRDMMSHRTGVARYDYSWYYFQSASRDTLMQRVQFMEPSEPLRKKWQYNNFMFLLQGMVAEKLSGRTWEQNIQDKILTPLGMTNTTVDLAGWLKNKDISKGYDVLNDSIPEKMDYYDISGMAPAGSINSSVNDMAKWLTVWINSGKYAGKEILPSPYVAEAISSQMVIGGGAPGKENPGIYLSNYGLGWMISSYRGHYYVEHGGNIDGFSASTGFFPSDSIGIVVLSNQNGSVVPRIVRNLIADRLLGLKYKDWESDVYNVYREGQSKAKEAKKTGVSSRKYGTSPSHKPTEYAGIYTSPGGESFELEVRQDSMFMHLPRTSLYLKHYHYDIFNVWDKGDIKKNDTSNTDGLKITFLTGETGDISAATIPLERPGPIKFTRQPKTPPVPRDSLEKYTGNYDLMGQTIRCYIKNENKLFVFIAGQPEYELLPVEKDKFRIKILPGYHVKFNSDGKGAITEVVFLQPDGTYTAKKLPEEKK
ncbi:MAG: serine hydrolase [Chitinophagaceae bacterium]|nr:MAG: serine hydrolase [Chitinophagaceae bacterium]